MVLFQEGDFSGSFFDLKKLIDQAQAAEVFDQLKAEIFLLDGQLHSELGLYQEAIASLCRAIEQDPKNLEAKIERATAYFETGQWDLALSDYLNVKSSVDLRPITEEILVEFSKGLSQGAAEGFINAAHDWIPSLMATASGAGNLLWAGVCDPLHVPQKLAHATFELFNYLSSTNLAKIAEVLEPEVYQLLSEWKQLDSYQRGDLSGKILGKYGFNFFSGAAVVKGIHAVKSLREVKKANQLFTLELISREELTKQQILEKSSQLQLTRAEAINKFKNDEEFLRSFKQRKLDEATVRRIIHESGYSTFPRPKHLPADFTVHFSDLGCGMVYFDPKNPAFHNIRVMPGKPHSPNQCQQKPYIKYKKDGQYRDKHGNVVPKDSVEAHIPIEEFDFNR